jgi:hypothetical protein
MEKLVIKSTIRGLKAARFNLVIVSIIHLCAICLCLSHIVPKVQLHRSLIQEKATKQEHYKKAEMAYEALDKKYDEAVNSYQLTGKRNLADIESLSEKRSEAFHYMRQCDDQLSSLGYVPEEYGEKFYIVCFLLSVVILSFLCSLYSYWHSVCQCRNVLVFDFEAGR